mmetsp:Transcript_20548/g.44601  ORF Transcript_20548/g.44601 Transcript_20548/m.44601 type:complete len:319 (+) Transcript_20548:105-1061(+)
MAAIAAVSAVSSMPVPYNVISAADPTALARKRRREISMDSTGALEDATALSIATHKIPKIEPTTSIPLMSMMSAPLLVATVAQPIVTVRQTEGAKRPQMKYDPSVPMTKEETSAWRREQRRKRNRESAAACRRRQRDRISELEDEVSDWKGKFDDALRKLKEADGEVDVGELQAQLESMFAIQHLQPKIEGGGRCSTPPNVSPEVITSMTIHDQGQAAMVADQQQSHVISPYDRPKFIPPLTLSCVEEDLHFPILEEDPLQIKNTLSGIIPADSINSRVENRQHLKLITRPAKSRLINFVRRGRWMDSRFGYHYLLTQ